VGVVSGTIEGDGAGWDGSTGRGTALAEVGATVGTSRVGGAAGVVGGFDAVWVGCVSTVGDGTDVVGG